MTKAALSALANTQAAGRPQIWWPLYAGSRLSLITLILILAEPTMVIFSYSNVTSSALIKYTSVSDTAWPSGICHHATIQKTAIDCVNFFTIDFFSKVTPTLFPSTVAIEVVSNCRRFFWQAGWSA